VGISRGFQRRISINGRGREQDQESSKGRWAGRGRKGRAGRQGSVVSYLGRCLAPGPHFVSPTLAQWDALPCALNRRLGFVTASSCNHAGGASMVPGCPFRDEGLWGPRHGDWDWDWEDTVPAAPGSEFNFANFILSSGHFIRPSQDSEFRS
jgi:hypothetical protein